MQVITPSPAPPTVLMRWMDVTPLKMPGPSLRTPSRRNQGCRPDRPRRAC
jgi:hypothetical protein